MEEKENGKGSDDFRVVDDGPEDVVRLTAPKRVRVEKTGGLAEQGIEVDKVEVVRDAKESSPFDPEAEWLEEALKKDETAVPVGWFVLLGVALLGVLAWAGLQAFSSSKDDAGYAGGDGVDADGGDLVGEKPLGKIAEIEAQREAEEHFENTEKLVQGFLGARTIEEKVKYVRHPDRVKPLMVNFYAWNELKPITHRKINEYRHVSLEDLPFLALKVEDTEGVDHAVLVEDGEDGLLVDWESFVCFQPMSIEDYARNEPTELTTLRAYVTPDYFYSYEFDDQESYASYRLKFRESEVLLNGYVKRGTELDEKFRKLFSTAKGGQLKPLIVKARFLENGKAKRSVLIEGLESTIWAYSKNPAEVASSKKSR